MSLYVVSKNILKSHESFPYVSLFSRLFPGRRKQITFNFELRKSSTGFAVFLRITEERQHKRYKSTVELKRKTDWDSKHQKIRPSETMYESWQGELDALMERAVSIHRDLEKRGTSSADKIIEELRHGKRRFFCMCQAACGCYLLRLMVVWE